MQRTQSYCVKESYLIFIILLSSNDSFYHDHPKTFHCQLYFEIFDNIINRIQDCYNQANYQINVHLQEILIRVFKEQGWEDDLQIIIQNYDVNEFDVPSLKNQLFLLQEIANLYVLDSKMQLSEMIALFQKLDTIKRLLVTEVIKLVTSILVMPAVNAVSEISFLSFKRIETYLRSTTTNNRLNHLLILHIHKLLTVRLNLTDVSDEFIERRKGRRSKFGL